MAAAEPLSVYLPALLVQRIGSGRLGAPEELPAATLFADLSGFTELAEQLAAAGSAGAERLSERLNVELGWRIACVHRHGGDVIKFAGDAIVALWPARTVDLAAAVGRACRAGLEIHTRRDGLGVRVGIGAGDVVPLALGDPRGRREFLVAGAPMVEMGRAERLAAPGEVLLTPAAWDLVAPMADGEPRVDGAVRLLRLRGAFASAAASATALELPQDVPEDMLRAFIPRVLRDQLAAGQGGWGSELRPVTVMFVDLPLLGGGGVEEVPHLEALFATIQREIYAVSGSVNKLLLDDKGLILLAAFGLPPQVHENSAARALRAALRISEHLRAGGIGHGVGLTTGRAYCGVYGSAERREYSLLGDVVNLAARLMQLAEDDILVDAATARALGDGLVGEPFIVNVRGKATPIVVHRPRRGRTTTTRLHTAGRLFGRERERAALVRAIERLAGGVGGLVLVAGEPGLGKSALVAELQALAGAAGVTTLVGRGGDIEQAVAYHAWQPIMLGLCALDGAALPAARRTWLEGQLADHPRGAEWAPLLAPLLDLPAAETPATERLPAAARAECARELVLHLLRRRRAPLAVVLDDAQWLDPASWSLCAALRRGVPEALVVVAGRFVLTEPPPPLAELIGDGAFESITLEALAATDVESMVAARLGVARLDAPLAAILRDRAEGNPLFAIELALALRAAGEVTCEAGVARVGAGGVAVDSLPDTVQGVVLSRFSQQTQQQQFTLKVASVVGREFGYRIVRDVHPLELDRDHVHEHCDALARASLIAAVAEEPEPAYAFRHSVIQETAYSLLAFAQRRQLHRAIAEWQETRGAVGPDAYPVLAHHWRRAEEPARARDYAERAGEQASAHGVFHEAAYFFQQALALDDAADRSDPARLRRARWRRHLGAARSEIGAHEASLQTLIDGMAELGLRLPSSRLGWIFMAIGQALRFAVSRRPRPEGDPRRLRDAELAHLTALVTLELFFAVRLLDMMVISLLSANLAERSGSYGPSASAYNNLAYLFGLVGAEAASTRLFARARMGDVRGQSRSYISQGLLALGRADFAGAEALFARAQSVGEEAGDRFIAASAISAIGTVCELRGDFAAALRQADVLAESARLSGNRRFELWAEVARGTAYTLLGRDADALIWISRRGDDLAEEDILTTVGVHGLRAYAYLRAGRLADALTHAERASAQIRRTGPGVFTHIKALTGVAETYLAAWADDLSKRPGTASAHEKPARRAVRDLATYARTFPIGRSRAERARGDLLWLTGRADAARAAWRRAVAAADAAGLVFDAALARLALARRAPAHERADDLAAALAAFTRAGATRERSEAERLGA